MGKTKIEWTDRTWNPFRGCTRVSEGCRNCYAERLAARFGKDEGNPYYGFSEFVETKDGKDARWTGKVEVIEKVMDVPLHIKQPSLIFVNSMSDTFHEDIPDAAILRLFEVMELCNGKYSEIHHHFQILTKRPERMLELYKKHFVFQDNNNIWFGVSIEDVKTVARAEIFKEMGNRVNWVSAEPLLEDITEAIKPYLSYIDWIVVGGESGPNARPMDVKWAYDLYVECGMTTKYFFKQMGGRKDKGSTKLYSPYSFYKSRGDTIAAREFEAKQYPHGWEF